MLWAGPQEALTHPLPGTSAGKTLDYTIHWSRTPEPETLGPAASESTVTSTDSGPRLHGSPYFPDPDIQEHCNDQDLVKKHQSITKVTPTPETPSCHTAIHCCGGWGGCRGGQEGAPQEPSYPVSSAPRAAPNVQQALNENFLMDEGMNEMDV